MAKILIMTIQVNFVLFRNLFTWPFRGSHPLLQLGCFGLDNKLQ